MVSKHTPSQMVLRQSIPNKKLHPRGSLLGFYGGLAQLGERLHGMQEVTGSIPVISTRKKSTAQECAVLFCCVCPAMQLLNSCWTFAESYGIILSAIAGIVHRLVYQPSKLRRWVRFPLPAPKDLNLERFGSFLFVLHWAVILQTGGGNATIEP